MSKSTVRAATVLSAIIALAGAGWVGLQIPPRSYPAPIAEPRDTGTVSIPKGLPEPVARYMRVAFGERIPRTESMMTWGRARANFGVWMPLRFRLYHLPGQAFKRDMEVTWFGLPVLHALDQYLDGKGMTGPVGTLASGPKVDQGANLILWTEASFMPSLLIADPRIRWEAIDATSARLIFPFGDGEDEAVFHFDPETGLLIRVFALRYKGNDSDKSRWYADTLSWQMIDGMKIPREVAVTWEADGSPWSVWTFEGVVWNADISEHLAISERPPR